jgi:hypothetical protein
VLDWLPIVAAIGRAGGGLFNGLLKPVGCDWAHLRFLPSFADVEKVHIPRSNQGKQLIF